MLVTTLGWAEVGHGVESWVQAIAIVLGGIWAYLKYGRGQPFISRAEVRIRACSLQLADRPAIRVAIEFRNVGACRTNLTVKTLEVFGMTQASPHDTPIDWGDALAAAPIYENDDWVEAGETVRDEVLVPVPAHDAAGDRYIAYQVKCDVMECGPPAWYHVKRIRWLRPPQPSFLHDQAVVAALD